MSEDPHDLLAGFVLDALDDDERARFADHLAHCEVCQRELPGMLDVAADLATAVSRPIPSDLADAVVATAIAEDPDVRPAVHTPAASSSSARGRPDRWLRVSWLAAAAVAVLIAAVAVAGVMRRGSESATVSEAQHVLDVASAADAHFMPLDLDVGTAKIVVSEGMNMAAVMADNLPMPPSGMEYRVWTIMDDGAVMSAATFMPDEHGSASAMLTTGVRDADRFVLTIDAADASGPEHDPLAEAVL